MSCRWYGVFRVMQLCDLVDVKCLDEIETETFCAMGDVGEAEPHRADRRSRLITWLVAINPHQITIVDFSYSLLCYLNLRLDDLDEMSFVH